MNGAADIDEYYRRVSESLLAEPAISRSTMMGLPCLRWRGQFFASYDRRTGNLVIKLPPDEVAALIAGGAAEPFAPSGRQFRAWAAITPAHRDVWSEYLHRAHDYVSSLTAAAKPRGPRRGTAPPASD
jgi:hypothetical protein